MSLEVQELKKSFQTEAGVVSVLKGVSLKLMNGEALAVLGPSGCGKSTLLHCIGTLTTPTEGRILIEGNSPFELDEADLARFRNRHIGFVFQDHYLLPQYSVFENVLLPAFADPDKKSGKEDRARQLLERVELSHRLDHHPAQLSGGERQRTAIARALINNPRLLLCDEPTGDLDQKTADRVADLLFDLHREQESILIVVTHSRELASRFERKCSLEDGKCVAA